MPPPLERMFKMNGNSEKVYIERALVEEMLENAQLISDGEYCGYCTEDVNLGSIPVADVVEIRHGRWIFKEYDKMPWCTQAICSECGAMVENNSNLSTLDWQQYFIEENKYCRRCNARMDANGDAS